MDINLSELNGHMDLFDILLGSDQNKNRETLFDYNFGRDTRPTSLKQGREFFRVEITTRNFHGNYKKISWFYHSDNDRKLWYMTSLSFRGMAFRYINTNIISKLELLEYLDLQGNQLEDFNWNTLHNLSSLHTVNLSSNKLKIVNPDIPFPLKKLRYLNLFNNNIESINFDIIYECSSLNRLNLSDNNISTINTEKLHQLKYLTQLDLSHNKLIEFNLDHLNSSIRQLKLNDNKISELSLSEMIIEKFINLDQLILSENKIKLIDIPLLMRLPSLHTIMVDGNLITELIIQGNNIVKQMNFNSNKIYNFIIYGEFDQLEVLELAYNDITEIDFTKAILNKLREIKLTLNPIEYIIFDLEKFSNLEIIDLLGTSMKEITLVGGTIVENKSIRIGRYDTIIYTINYSERCFELILPPNTNIVL